MLSYIDINWEKLKLESAPIGFIMDYAVRYKSWSEFSGGIYFWQNILLPALIMFQFQFPIFGSRVLGGNEVQESMMWVCEGRVCQTFYQTQRAKHLSGDIYPEELLDPGRL